MKRYLIQRDKMFFSSFGWIPRPREAYIFFTEENARNFIEISKKKNKMLFYGDIKIVPQDVPKEELPQRNKVVTDYNPYGYENERSA